MKNVFLIVLCCLFGTQLLAQCTLAGKITDEKGEPVIGAHVMLLQSNKGTLSNEAGRYELADLAVGEYQVRISHVSYRTVTRKIKVQENVPRYLVNVQLIEVVIEMDELIVKAIRAGEKTPVTYTNLNKEDLEKNNLGQDVPFLLRWTPSVVVTSDAGTGIGYTGIRVRGTDPTRINVTINGIPLNDAESQGTFWVDLPDFASSTDNIQIQRGVGTSTNGAGAFGATVNLNTNKLQANPYGIISSSVGSFNTIKANASFGTGLINDKFAFDGRISQINSDGYIDRGSADLSSYYLSGAYLGKNNSLRINVFSGHEVTYQAWNGVPAQFIDDEEKRTFNTAGTEKSGSPYDNEVDDYTQTHYQAFYNHQLNPNWNGNIGLHYTKGTGFFEQYKANQSLADYGLEPDLTERTDLIRRRWLDNDFYGFTYGLNYISNSRKLDFTLGGAYHIYEGQHFGEIVWARYASTSEIRQRYYDNDARKTDFNIFGKASYQLTNSLNTYLDLQFRQVGYEFLGLLASGESLLQEESLSFFNPKLGLFYELNDKAQVYGSFGVGNREPNRNDYTESSTESRPSAETLYNTEVGYRQNWSKYALSVNLYHMHYNDQLVLTGQINDVGAATRINVPSSYRAGIELMAGTELTKGLDFNASATFSQNKVKEFTEYIDNWDTGVQKTIDHQDTDLSFSPNVIASGELTYEALQQKPNLSLRLSLQGKYVSKQYIDNTSNENSVLDPYFFSDFRIGLQWKTNWLKEIGLTFLVQNIFDQKYSSNAWTYRYITESDPVAFDPYSRLEGENTYNQTGFFPQATRNYLLGLTIKF